jgi:hypothetical protein
MIKEKETMVKKRLLAILQGVKKCKATREATCVGRSKANLVRIIFRIVFFLSNAWEGRYQHGQS